ncbi:GntR family transcriptional regulator [Amycolatopsis albispora]|uniref:GntR family transcriptional regulator n=1 Tax=Amycolatopsis albispora TaxID=1804986 RepID=UPI001962E16F|nr:GntR family transcriptional regulator [Amycolatopsis albispora]
MPATPIARAEPLRDAVYARIVELFWSGAYPPGTAVTEAALSRELDVSRTPVREALLRLEAEGVLRSALARGFTVRPLDRREASELYPILGALESLAVRTAGTPSAARVRDLERILANLEDCTDPVRRWRLDSDWHATLVTASGNQQLEEMVARVRTNLSRYELTYMRETVDRTEPDRQHLEVLVEFASGENERAAQLLSAHWDAGMRAVLTWLDQTGD